MSERHLAGLKELSLKLNQLGTELAAKTLRQATMNAATPVVREARLRIPVGDIEHRTYKGNLVAPGFGQRSIRKSSKIIDGRAVVSIGVRREAFYATQFVELGTQKMDATPWLVPAFENQRDEVERRLADQLRTKIAKLTR